MIFDIGHRRNGKTTRMIQWFLHPLAAADEDRMFLVPTLDQAKVIQGIAKKDFGREIPDSAFVTPATLDRLRGRRDVRLSIDNVEHVLQVLLGASVELERVSASGAVEQWPERYVHTSASAS